MSEVKVALVQTFLHWQDPHANLGHLDSKIQGLDTHVDVVILPEMFSTGFTMTPENCPPETGEVSLNWMRKTASAINAAIVGSTVWKAGGQYYNRLFFVKPDGDTAAYDKKHTFTLAGEHKVYTAGNKKLHVLYKGFTWCPLICYDLRFPVWSRNTEAYDILLYVANWPKVRIEAWDALLKARSIENLCYTIGANRIGSDGNKYEYSGHSAVYDALGHQLTFSNSEEVLYATLSKDHLVKTREKLQFLEDQDQFTIQ